jgi:hypothetical protein
MHNELRKAVEHLVEQVLNYQSDTWDSPEYGVTREDAERAAAHLIYQHLFDEQGMPHVDGADIGFAVESVDEDVTTSEPPMLQGKSYPWLA